MAKHKKTKHGLGDEYFKTRFDFDKRRNIVWKHITDYMKRWISKEDVVLELGAGYCDFINNVNAQEKHALDTSKLPMRYANKDVKKHIQSCTNLKNFKRESMDIVFASNLFEHLSMSDFHKSVEQIKRVLKKNGKFIIIQPNYKYCYKEYFDDHTHITIFTHESISNGIGTHGFKIIEKKAKFLPFSMKSKLKFLSGLTGIYLRLPVKPFAKQMLIVAKKQ